MPNNEELLKRQNEIQQLNEFRIAKSDELAPPDIVFKEFTGQLVEIKKEEDDDSSEYDDGCKGSAKWSIAIEGVLDKDGDRFDPYSIEMEREKGTLVSFQHNYQPAGVWELSRSGNTVYANVQFLDTQAGQDTRKYVKAMGDSCQFSFRARMSEYGFADDVPGIIFKKVKAFETSPVFIGAGETNLVTVKSLNNEGKGMDEDKTQEENSPVEVNKENKDNEVSKMPTAEEIADVLLAKQKAAEEAEKEASKTDVDRAKEQLEKLTDDQKKELGIPSGGSSTTPKVYAEAKKNGGTDDLMKAANDRQESLLR